MPLYDLNIKYKYLDIEKNKRQTIKMHFKQQVELKCAEIHEWFALKLGI